MEPMNLGTPTNSGPSSPSVTPSGSPYLPAFLLGEPTSPLPNSTSPQSKRGHLNEFNGYTSPRALVNQSFHSQIVSVEPLGSSEKSSGPPIRDLFDSVASPTFKSKNPAPDANIYVSSVARQFNDTRSPYAVNQVADSTWVTVFGYPPAVAAFILSQMASLGHILSKEVPASGNWMHLQFSSKLEAKRALSCNGKIFSGSVMVGVVPCRDESILERNLDRTAQSTSIASPRTPLSPPIFRDNYRNVDASLYESPHASPRITHARSLVTRVDNDIIPVENSPQRSSGIVSKAMGYFLGW